MCVCCRASCYIPDLYVQSEVVSSFLRAFKDMYCVDFAENVCSGDMASFACHNDQQLGCFSTKNTPIVLDTIINGTVYEPLARSDH